MSSGVLRSSACDACRGRGSHHPARLSRPLRAAQPTLARAAGSSSSGGTAGRTRFASLDATRLPALLQELAQLTQESGPRGPIRALQGLQALLSVAQQAATEGAVRPSAPVLLRRLFERLGATYVKLGQFIASSPTLFPEEYVLEFQKCLDRTPAVPFATIRAIVEAELGQPLSVAFESVDAVPLASASVAQVHAAVLRGSRKEVVLKVLKPDVSDALAADLAFLAAAARILEFLAPDLARGSVGAIAADIRASMLDELDFTKEASNLAAFSAYLAATDNGDCVAPFVYKHLSTRRLMTMERLRGVPLTDLDSIRGAAARRGSTPEALLIGALNVWAGSVIGCETFHADLHAGNLLVLQDGRVGFIDFGIVGRVSPAVWVAVNALLGAAAGGDWRTAAAALVAMGAADEAVDVDAFGADLEGLAESVSSLRATVVVDQDGAALAVDETDVSRLVLDLVRVGDKHGVKFPREFGLLLKQLLYFDRYQKLLAPGLDVLNDPRVRGLGDQRGRRGR